MKIVFLNKRYYTNKDLVLDRFGRLFHLPVQLIEQGHNVIILCADYRSNVAENFFFQGVVFLSIPMSYNSIAGFLIRSWDHIRKFEPNVILASGDSHFGFIGALISKHIKVPFAFDLYDDYTTFGSNKLPFMKTIFKWTVRHADTVICASSHLKTKISNHNKNVVLIENGVDDKLFRPICKLDARDRLGISRDETIIGYFGTIGQNYGIEILSESVSKLQKQYPGIKLLIAGKNGAKVPLSHPHIDFRGPVPQNEIPFFINASDVVVIPYLPDPQINMSSPCKLPEYLACGVPVVSTRVSDISNLLSFTPAALCDPGDCEDMVRAIRWQLENRIAVPLPKHLKWKALGEKLNNLLNDLVTTKVS